MLQKSRAPALLAQLQLHLVSLWALLYVVRDSAPVWMRPGHL